MRNFCDIFVEKIKTQTLYSITFFPLENLAVYEITWKNIVQLSRPRTLRLRIARWIPKSTNTHSDYVILAAYPLWQFLHERASVLRCSYIACPVSVIAERGVMRLLHWMC
jgi:hypothetical protein